MRVFRHVMLLPFLGYSRRGEDFAGHTFKPGAWRGRAGACRSDWFKGLKGTQRRFVPYNGQPSDEQLRWLRRVLAGSAAAGERVIVAAHQPVYPNATNLSNLPFNFQEILAVLHAFPGVVVTWLAGALHRNR